MRLHRQDTKYQRASYRAQASSRVRSRAPGRLIEQQAEIDRRAGRQQLTQTQPHQILNHVHTHGLSAEDVAEVSDRQRDAIREAWAQMLAVREIATEENK